MDKQKGKPSAAARPAKPNSKRTGEISEAAFLHKAVGLGFKVTKPWGDSERYDFVIDSGSRLWRVQIKSTSAMHAGGYQIQPIHQVYGEKKTAYTAAEIDALAAHIVPLDVWYVLPVSALGSGTSLRLYPEGGCKTPRFEHYREAWHLLRDAESEEDESGSGESTGQESKRHELQIREAEPQPTPTGDPDEPVPDPSESPLSITDGPWPAIETPIPHWKPVLPPLFARYLTSKRK